MDETDHLFHPQGALAEAQRLAAALYGAAETFYLTNGSTIGVQAMILAAVAPGEKILLARSFHLSAFSALVLGGAIPVYLPSRWLDVAGPIPPTLDEIAQCVQAHPDIRAIFLVHPSYYGLGRFPEELVAFCRQRRIVLLVDEAHGAHLTLLPPGSLLSALAYGADVVVQSVHKTLGSLVGTAQLHRAHGSRVPAERLQRALNLLQSTSSNYLLLASLDLARRWAWQSGRQAFRDAVRSCSALRTKLRQIPGIRPLEPADVPELAGCAADPTRLVVDVSGLGFPGVALETLLQEEFQIGVEFCDQRNAVFVLGPGDAEEAYIRLERAFWQLRKVRPPQETLAHGSLPPLVVPPLALFPREAAFCPGTRVALSAAVGRVCGELITVYPPGIPLICPGEQFTTEVVAVCEELRARNVGVFASDGSLATVTVLDLAQP
jgi:arginine/lysine/ornithine decarboxylase